MDTTASEEARLQADLLSLQQQLKRAVNTLTKIRGVRETVRVRDAARAGRLAYPTAGDDGLSRTESSLWLACSEVKQLALECETQPQKKKVSDRAPRRQTVKIEEETACDANVEGEVDYDTDATIDEPIFVEAEIDPGAQDVPVKLEAEPVQAKPSEPIVTVGVAAIEEVVETEDVLQRSIAKCHIFEIDTTSDAVKSLNALNDSLRALSAKYPSVKPRKSSVCVPRQDVKAAVTASEAALNRLVQSELKLAVVQPALRLYETMEAMAQPELIEALLGPKQSLQNIFSSFAETVGGMKRALHSPARDSVAHECFTLAVYLVTTDCHRRRLELIDAVLRALKSGFKPAIALRKEIVRTKPLSLKTRLKKQRNKPYDRIPSRDVDTKTDKWTVPWAGRVLLLSANVVAYMIATKAIGKAERFFYIVQLISWRHPMFLSLFERPRAIVLKACKKIQDVHPLDLKHETRRVQEACAKAMEQQ